MSGSFRVKIMRPFDLSQTQGKASAGLFGKSDSLLHNFIINLIFTRKFPNQETINVQRFLRKSPNTLPLRPSDGSGGGSVSGVSPGWSDVAVGEALM